MVRKQEHPGQWVQEAVFSKDRSYVLKRLYLETVVVRRAMTRERLGPVLKLPKRGIYSLAVSRDESLVVTGEG